MNYAVLIPVVVAGICGVITVFFGALLQYKNGRLLRDVHDKTISIEHQTNSANSELQKQVAVQTIRIEGLEKLLAQMAASIKTASDTKIATDLEAARLMPPPQPTATP